MQYIIDFKDNINDAEISTYLSENNCKLIKTYNNFSKVYLIESINTPPIIDIVESVINNDDILISPLGEFVSVNQFYRLPNPDYPSITISTTDNHDWWKNYVLQDPDLESPTITISRKGIGVSVYIMDSGIDQTHPEFVDTTIINLSSITDNFLDTTGHGTAIAGVISGKTCGLSNATLKIVKIFEQNYSTKQSDLLNALNSILEDFSNNTLQAAVLNCSWNISKNEYVENKLRYLITQGISIVVAAGNSGLPIENVTPASMPEVLTIGSYGPDFEPSNFSNYSAPSIITNTTGFVNTGQLDGWAPGEQIWIATLGGGYGYANGTSLSAAIHSCVLAYNITDTLLENYNRPEFFKGPSVMELISISLARRLMDLSDPKYISSSDRVSTLANRYFIDEGSLTDYYETHLIAGETKILGRVFNPQITKSVEIIDPLPDGLIFISSGQIAGCPRPINGSHQLFKSSIRVTNIHNEVMEVTIVIAILSPDFDISQVPADDPVLQINFSDEVICSKKNILFTNL